MTVSISKSKIRIIARIRYHLFFQRNAAFLNVFLVGFYSNRKIISIFRSYKSSCLKWKEVQRSSNELTFNSISKFRFSLNSHTFWYYLELFNLIDLDETTLFTKFERPCKYAKMQKSVLWTLNKDKFILFRIDILKPLTWSPIRWNKRKTNAYYIQDFEM